MDGENIVASPMTKERVFSGFFDPEKPGCFVMGPATIFSPLLQKLLGVFVIFLAWRWNL
jgi:hypothetical protein